MNRFIFLRKYSNLKINSIRIKDFNSKKSIFNNQFNFKNEVNNRIRTSIYKIDSLPEFIKNDRFVKNIRATHFKSLELINKNDFKNNNLEKNNLRKIKEINSFIENDMFLVLQKNINLLDKKSNKKLDDFFLSRLYTRSLIDQYLSLHVFNSTNVFNCNINNMLFNILKEVNGMTNFYYDKDIKFYLKGSKNINILSIYPYLYYILIEIIKNAANSHLVNNVDSPIYITFHSNNEYITVKVFDKGLGFSKKDIDKVFTYAYTTNNNLKILDEYELINQPLLNGFGFGLPLSRLYCKYLNGSLDVNPIKGIGTEDTINLKRNKTKEILFL